MKLFRLLREWWDGIKEHLALIAFTNGVLILSKLAKPKLEELALKLNKKTDSKYGAKAEVVQRQVADCLEAIVLGLRA